MTSYRGRWLVRNGLKASGAGCEDDVGWAGGVGTGAVLIGWGSGIAGCVLGAPEEGKKEKLVGGL